MNQKDIKCIVVSNNCFSMSNSNGRTMANLMSSFAANNLAQFYIHGEPDFSICKNYYCVSDRDALSALGFSKCMKNGKINEETNKSKKEIVQNSNLKNVSTKGCRNRYIRNVVWKLSKWWNIHFDDFLQDFRPDVVLLQAGDAPFMYYIARKISKKLNIPLYMFNTENYVLKDTIYNSSKKNDPFHFLLKRSLKREYKKTMDMVAYCVYCTEYLEEKYQQKYPHPNKSIALYVSSDFPLCEEIVKDKFIVSYCGNLGVGRTDALYSFATVLNDVNDTAILRVYGNFSCEEDKQKLCSLSNVEYMGFASYEELYNVYCESSLLIHCELEARLKNLETAFSTKIGDSLKSGRPFLVYASRKYPFVQYLEKNKAAHIASDENELYTVLRKCMEEDEYRKLYVERAIEIAQKNHNLKRNSQVMYSILSGDQNEFK